MVRPAAAADTDPVLIASTNQITAGSGVTTALDYSGGASGGLTYFRVSNVATDPSPTSVSAYDLNGAVVGTVGLASRTRTGVAGLSQVDGGSGVVGVATGGASAYGVWGDSGSGIGVFCSSTSGYALVASGNGRIGMASFLPVGPPTTGSFAIHDIVGDEQGDLWACIAGGTPGTWRKLTAAPPAKVVSFHPLAPARVYDSRTVNGGAGPLVFPATRNISVADARNLTTGAATVPNYVPAGAVAITCNVTVVNTQGVGGFLTLNPGGTTTVSAATINWFGPNQILNNGVTLAVDTNRVLTAVVGPNQATDFVVDVTGYFL